MKIITLLAAMAIAAVPSMATAAPSKYAMSSPVPGPKSARFNVGLTITQEQIDADIAAAAKAEAKKSQSGAMSQEGAEGDVPPAKAGKMSAEAEQAIDDAVSAAVDSSHDLPATSEVDLETWGDLEETDRYLLIMGNADGFSSAGAGAPCFPGKTNADLSSALTALQFDNERADSLTETLATLSEDPASCSTAPLRGYSIDLLKTMPDAHIATYLTGLVRAYSFSAQCPAEHHQYAAATVVAAIFSAAPGAQPVPVVQEALEKGCEGIEASAEHSS